MRKKILAVCLSMAMLFAMSLPVFAAETVIAVKPPETLPKAGETFTVTVDVSGNQGLAALQLTLSFDKSLMSCTRAMMGDALAERDLGALNKNAEDGVRLAVAAVNNMTEDGNLITLTFYAEKDISAFDFALSNMELQNEAQESVAFTVTGATLTAEEPTAPEEPSTPTEPEQPDEPDEPDEDPEQPEVKTIYSDVKAKDAEYIAYATEHGLFQGYADGTFRPNNPVTRGAYVAVLWRLAGKPDAPAAAFTDIKNSNEEFRKAIAWASSKGYVDGYADGSFRPGASVSRRAALKILYQYNGGVNDTNPLFASLYSNTYADVKALSDVFKAPVHWGIYHEFVEADTKTSFGVARDATRAELARIFALYDEMTR